MTRYKKIRLRNWFRRNSYVLGISMLVFMGLYIAEPYAEEYAFLTYPGYKVVENRQKLDACIVQNPNQWVGACYKHVYDTLWWVDISMYYIEYKSGMPPHRSFLLPPDDQPATVVFVEERQA